MDEQERSAWQQADRLFVELMDLEPAQQAARLASLSLSADVRSRVEQLLGVARESRPWLDVEAPSFDAWSGNPDAAPTGSMRGHRIGAWEIMDELGRGGMAVVYRARRVVGSVEQLAALKVVTVASMSRHGIDRFQRETKILARLDHPHIVGLIDAGVTDDGTPWLAMPLLGGVHITQWCDERALDTRGIVQLFLQVTAAVSSAHRNLVIHCDLKPSNVLVDAEGQVRLLDFGIARLLDQGDSATVTQWRAMTPQYAAPEQHAGANATTAVDVHGLGALLYRLLTGRPPRELEAKEITLPSQVAARQPVLAARHGAALRNDLDRVLMKALASNPADRYATVDALSADLARWLAGRPVLATTPGRLYRLRKFVRRHRLGVAAGTAIVLALAVGIGGTLWQARIAEHQAARVVAVKDFLVELLESTDPTNTEGKDPRASELLQKGAERINDTLKDRPELRAELLLLIGRAQLAHARIEDAAHSLDSALALFGNRTLKNPNLHAELLSDRAMVAYEQGELANAVDMLHKADALLSTQDGDETYTPLREKVRASLADLTVVALGETEEGAAIARDLAERMRKAGRTREIEYGYALRAMGGAADLEGRHEEAIDLMQQAEQVMLADPARLTELANIRNELAIALSGAKRSDEAETMFASALELQRRIYGERNPTTLITRGNLAAEQMRNNKAEQAASEYESILSMQRELLGDEAHPDLAGTLGFLAIARYRAGELEAAHAAASQGRQMLQQLPESDRSGIQWLAPLLGLLELELQAPRSGNLLEQGGFGCESVLTDMSPLRRWICIARAWQSRASNTCPIAKSDVADTTKLDIVDRRWWVVYWALRARCDAEQEAARRAIAELNVAENSLPAWLHKELLADGLLQSN